MFLLKALEIKIGNGDRQSQKEKLKRDTASSGGKQGNWCLGRRVLCGEQKGTRSVYQLGLELMRILLPLLSQCWYTSLHCKALPGIFTTICPVLAASLQAMVFRKCD